MCGIVGLFLKDASLEPRLGGMLADMLVTMTDRGPDSAGIAIYGDAEDGVAKLSVQSPDPEADFPALETHLVKAFGAAVNLTRKDTHAILTVAEDRLPELQASLAEAFSQLTPMSRGDAIEIFKEVGLPQAVVDRFGLGAMGG
ncbi:MAG: glutamine amidotransferase, partial [Pseudomonadota bacterium]